MQLIKFNYFAFLRFNRFFFKKFASKPKLRTFIGTKYFTKNHLARGINIIQLKVQDIIFFNFESLRKMKTFLNFLKLNISKKDFNCN